MLNFYAFSALTNSIVSSGIAFFFWLKKSKHKNFILFNNSIALWSFFYFLWQISATKTWALLCCKLLTIGSILIPFFFFCFAIDFTETSKKYNWLKKTGLIFVFVLCVFSFTNLLVRNVEPILNFIYWPKAGPLYPVFLLYFFSYTIIAVYILIKERKPDLTTLLMVIGLVIGFIGGSTNYFLWFDIYIPPFGNILVSIYALIMAFTVVTYKLLDIKLFLSKTASRLIILGIIISTYLIIYKLITLYFGNFYLKPILLLTNLLFIIIISEGYSQFREKAQTIFEAIIWRPRYNYKEATERLNLIASRSNNVEDLFFWLQEFFEKNIFIKSVLFYMPDNYEGAKKTMKKYNLWEGQRKNINAPDIDLDSDHPLIKYLSQNNIVYYSESNRESKEQLSLLNAEVLIPCVYENEILSIIVIQKQKAIDIKYTPLDRSLFGLIALHTAIVLYRLRPFAAMQANYQKSMEMAEKASNQAAYGGLSLGIAHELRNPLGMMLLNAQIVEKGERTPDLIENFIQIIIRNTQRLTKILDTMMAYGRPISGKREKSDLKKIIEEVILLSTIQCKKLNIALETDINKKIKPIHCDPVAINQAILNIVVNAMQAIKQNGLIRISVQHCTFKNLEGANIQGVQITIFNNGPSLAKDQIEKIFDPFYTTKYENVGLGLSIVLGIVNAHKGLIDIQSDNTRGTQFILKLPYQG